MYTSTYYETTNWNYYTVFTFGTRDFQDNNVGLAAHWDFSGDPCPIEKYEWAIHKFDGTIVLPMTDIPEGNVYASKTT